MIGEVVDEGAIDHLQMRSRVSRVEGPTAEIAVAVLEVTVFQEDVSSSANGEGPTVVFVVSVSEGEAYATAREFSLDQKDPERIRSVENDRAGIPVVNDVERLLDVKGLRPGSWSHENAVVISGIHDGVGDRAKTSGAVRPYGPSGGGRVRRERDCSESHECR